MTTTDIYLDKIDRLIRETGTRRRDLIPILQALQERYHYLPPEALRRIPDLTEIHPADVTGVATFYRQFRLRPAGEHRVKVCIGTACHVKGAEHVFDAFRQHLRIEGDYDTDADRLFTVEKVACLGCCMLAPAVQIDEITYGFVQPGGVGQVLRDFLAARAVEDAPDGGAAATGGGEARLCLCTSCRAGGADKIRDALRRDIAALGLDVRVRAVGCTGASFHAPLVELALADGRRFRYGRLSPEAVRPMLRRHFRPPRMTRRLRSAARAVLERILTDEAWAPVTRYTVDLREGPDRAYETRQVRIATARAGELDPADLAAYRAAGGFEAYEKCLAMAPAAIVRQIDAAELRGRGGAGFPTGWKWNAVRNAEDGERFLVCNADEGDPGAFMDRMILESFPFRVIEGMLIAARAIGARRGFVYVRQEYPLAVRSLARALEACREAGLLDAFEIEIVKGAGAFVCGEETALLAAIEGRRGMPHFRPPYPSERGLWGRPTVVNNVETLATAPWILREGAAAFAAMGTESSRGTKVFALAGKIARGGLIEVPMGITLREIVEQIGGGVPDGRTLKAIQVGGPSGGCVPAALADTPVDYLDLVSVGSMMGSGGLVVLDDADCMVDIARYFLAFTQDESCGKCTFCRIGTRRMLEILQRLCAGSGRDGDLEELEHLAEATRTGSLCGLGRTAPNPVLSTMKHFRAEYEAHIAGCCPALKCKRLIRYVVTDECIGCTRCAQQCPVDAIAPRPYERHEIDDTLCTRCDGCRAACPVDAIEVRTGGGDAV